MIGDNPNDQQQPENEPKARNLPQVSGTTYSGPVFFQTTYENVPDESEGSPGEEESDGDYPYPDDEEDPLTAPPSVYYCKRLKNVTFDDDEAGFADLQFENTGEFQYIRTLAETWLPPLTVIVAFPHGGRWWTEARGPSILLVKFNVAIGKGGTGKATMWVRDPPDSTGKGSETETDGVMALFARLGEVAKDDFGYVTRIDGGWELINAECPDEDDEESEE